MDFNVPSQSEFDELEYKVNNLVEKVDFILEKMDYKKKWIIEKKYSYDENLGYSIPRKVLIEILNTDEEKNEWEKKMFKNKKFRPWDYDINYDYVLNIEN